MIDRLGLPSLVSTDVAKDGVACSYIGLSSLSSLRRSVATIEGWNVDALVEGFCGFEIALSKTTSSRG